VFDSTSRYASIAEATLDLTQPDGSSRITRYKLRRFIPPAATMAPLAEHTVIDGERLDAIAARYVGDPTAFWRLCDANEVLRPEELERVGTTINIAMPRP
jgi:hypothetical protein